MTKPSMARLEGPSHGPQAGGKPGHLVMLLHGYGADGNDLIGLAPVLAPLMPDTVFHAPNAPYPCDGNPTGYQWFGLARLDPHLVAEGVRAAAPFVDAFLDETMAKYGLDESKTVLMGFSQGTMMSLHVGLRRPRQLAGIVGFSGMLAAPEALGTEIKTRPPVLLLHGDSDPMIPHMMTERAVELLRQHGVQVRMHIAQGVGHGIDQTGLSHAARFLLEAFKLPLPQQGT
jgi:phospholipase/carboxylesterase